MVPLTPDPALPTLLDYGFDGHASLDAIIGASAYRTLAQVVASLTLFSHPDTVRQTGCRPVIRVIRNAARRGDIIELDGRRVGLDDNKAPTDVFLWCNAMKRRPRDVQFNHVYLNSQDPEIYTSLANLCVTPSFLAKLTDTNPEIRDLLRYRVWKLYGWRPAGLEAPAEPDGYASHGRRTSSAYASRGGALDAIRLRKGIPAPTRAILTCPNARPSR